MSSDKKSRVAKVFGIDDSRPEEPVPTIANADPYAETDPTVAEWARELTPTIRDVGRYFYNLFPFIHWIGKYNLTWFLGDFIAGMLPPSHVPSSNADLTFPQAPLSEPLLFPRVWRMRNWPTCPSSTVFTLRSWVS